MTFVVALPIALGDLTAAWDCVVFLVRLVRVVAVGGFLVALPGVVAPVVLVRVDNLVADPGVVALYTQIHKINNESINQLKNIKNKF